jgi:transcription elongation factor Elf1
VSEIDTDYTNQPVCPYCGHEERDAWEIDFGPGLDGDTTTSCGNCGEDYFCSREATIRYTTEKVPPTQPPKGEA